MKGALDGIRVLDLTRVIAGPFCTQQLADLGAEVIKVEPQGGDDSRSWSGPKAGGESYAYLAYNRGKRGIALDIRTNDGQKIIRQLIEKSDVLVENFRPGVMKKLGLDYESLKERSPKLIYCSISAYGQKNPRGGMDSVVQAESGLMSITGEPDGGPLLHGIPIVDTITGIYACSAILAAIVSHGRTGTGQHLDLAMFDIALAVSGLAGQHYLVSGKDPERYGNGATQAAPVGVYKTQNGLIRLLCVTDKMFNRLAAVVLERPDLLENPKFSTNQARLENKAELQQMLDRAFATNTREYWMKRIEVAGLTAGAVKTMSQALESDDTRASGVVKSFHHATAGTVRLLSSPMHRTNLAGVDLRPPPLLGQHTEEVLSELLAMSIEDIDALRSNGTIAPQRSSVGN